MTMKMMMMMMTMMLTALVINQRLDQFIVVVVIVTVVVVVVVLVDSVDVGCVCCIFVLSLYCSSVTLFKSISKNVVVTLTYLPYFHFRRKFC